MLYVDQENFQDWLRAYMRANDLKNDAMARQVGVSQPTVSNWINGNFAPDPKQLRKLAEVTGVDTIWLFRLVGYLPPSGEGKEAEMRPKVLAVLKELETLPDEILDLLADQIKHVLRPRSRVFRGKVDDEPAPAKDASRNNGDVDGG